MSGIWNENLATMGFDNSKNYNGDIGVWINGKYITYAPKQYECMIMSAETLHWVYPIRTNQKRLSFLVHRYKTSYQKLKLRSFKYRILTYICD